MDKEFLEKEFLKFLKQRLLKSGGSMPIHHLTGHMSQVRPQIREAIGTSKMDIARFIEKYCTTFILEKGIVSLVAVQIKDYDSDDSSVSEEISLPSEIKDGKGVVVKLTPTFGFIKTHQPVKSSVYFRAKDFGLPEDSNLTDCGLHVGTMVIFNAVREKKTHAKSKYQAKQVWKMNQSDDTPIVSNVPKKRVSGLYDPVNLDGEGKIQNVFPTHGFIIVGEDRNNTVFFFKKCVLNYDNITDLTKVFSIGDLVEFCSHRTTKTGAKARWEATKVWKKLNKPSSIRSSNVPPISSCSPTNSLNPLPKLNFDVPEKATLLDYYHQTVKNVDLTPKNGDREMIYDQVGKICPRPSGCVIKFGKNLEQLADGDSSLYFIDGTKVEDVSWEFTEGEEVKFDAMRIKSPPWWKALIVWMGGEKPNIVISPEWPDLGIFSCEEDVEGNDENSSVSCHEMLSQSSSFMSEVLYSETEELKVSKIFSGNKSPEIDSKSKPPSLSNSPFSERPPSSLSSSKESEQSLQVSQLHNLVKMDYSRNTSDWYEMSVNYETQMSFETKDEPIQVTKNENPKKPSGIKKYENVEAKIRKVFSMFAEASIESSLATQNTLSFSSKLFYKDANSMDDLDVSDLREVLKVDETIFLNFFEVVDDDGQYWLKATLAWYGLKPKKVDEMTPEEFIEQNKLSVSVREIICDIPEQIPQSNSHDRKLHPKILEENKQMFAAPENKAENKLICDQSPIFSQSQLLEMPVFDIKLLSAMICEKIMKKENTCFNDKVDIDDLSSDIVNLVQQKYAKVCEKSETSPASNFCCSCVNRKKELPSKTGNFEDKEVQTISTGSIWFPSVFVDN